MKRGVNVLWERLGTASESEMCRQFVDPAIHDDPTIPTMEVHCAACERVRKVRYVRYGSGLTYLYACPHCHKFWTRSNGGPSKRIEAQDHGGERVNRTSDEEEVHHGKSGSELEHP